MIEGIGVLIVICAFLFGFQRPGGVKDQVSQRIKNAPTDAQAQQVFASSALFWIGVVVVIAVMGISVMGGIVAESESQHPLMDVYRDMYGVERLQAQPVQVNPSSVMPTEIPIVVVR